MKTPSASAVAEMKKAATESLKEGTTINNNNNNNHEHAPMIVD